MAGQLVNNRVLPGRRPEIDPITPYFAGGWGYGNTPMAGSAEPITPQFHGGWSYGGQQISYPGDGTISSNVVAQPGQNPNSIPGTGTALSTAGDVNQFNLDYQANAIPNYAGLTGDVSAAAGRLLDPNDPQANYDVSMHGAERAVGSGIAGSGLAGETTGRMRELDRERRAMLGNQLLSGQVSRLPQPVDPTKFMVLPSQVYGEQNAFQRLLLSLMNRGGYGGGGGRGQPYYGGTPSAPGTAPVQHGQSPWIDLPYGDGEGDSSSTVIPGGGLPEPSPDASEQDWAAYYASLPFPGQNSQSGGADLLDPSQPGYWDQPISFYD